MVAATDIASSLGFQSSANVLPGLGIALNLAEGNAFGAALSALTVAAPQIGIPLSIAASLFGGGLFGGDDAPEIPTIKGSAEIKWDANGNLQVVVTQSENGGGEHVQNLLAQLLAPLEQALSQESNAGYGLIPQRLPSVSLHARTHSALYLNYVEADPTHPQAGQAISRYYDGSGNHTGDPQNIAGQFLDQALNANAFVYRWESATATSLSRGPRRTTRRTKRSKPGYRKRSSHKKLRSNGKWLSCLPKVISRT